MKTGEPVESLSLSKILVLYMRKYQSTYGKTGWEIYIHILYQNTMEKAEIFFATWKDYS